LEKSKLFALSMKRKEQKIFFLSELKYIKNKARQPPK